MKLSQDDLFNYSDTLIWAINQKRNTPLKSKDIVIVNFDYLAQPLAEALFSRLIEQKFHPVMECTLSNVMKAELYINSSFGQLMFNIPGKIELYASAAAVIRIHAPDRVGEMIEIDPRAIINAKQSNKELTKILDTKHKAGNFTRTDCIYPTKALAEKSGLSLEEYTHKLKRACFLNMPYPVKEWQRIADETNKIADNLTNLNIKSLHVESELCDLKFDIGSNRRFQNACGANIPGYEVYVAPDCRSVSGVYFADLPSFYLDRPVYGIQLEFVDGIAIRAKAMGGEQFLLDQLRSDGGARRIGEFSLTEKRISRIDHFMAQTILDENFGADFGNCHLALGQSLMDTCSLPPEIMTQQLLEEYGFNRSLMHWDLVNTEDKTVTATLSKGNKKIIYQSGSFVWD